MYEDNLNSDPPVSTYYAPADRATPAEVESASTLVNHHPLFQAIMESIDGYLMILNHERQLLAMNNKLLTDLKITNIQCLLGNRPGEILGCIHADEGPGGCGTSKICSSCGAVISIWDSQKTKASATNECLATVKHGTITECHEFRVRATPVKVGNKEFTVVVFQDISSDKRREILERTFFHDIMNTLGGLLGWSYLLTNIGDLDPKLAADHILTISKRLQDEIEEQRRLVQAEQGELEANKKPLEIQQVLDSVKNIFLVHSAAQDKTVLVEEFSSNLTINTDSALLGRVLINMVKNALEAISPRETVTVSAENDGALIIFKVHNPGMIPPDISQHIFQRSFSTKAPKGRGIGTYSMKLFGERYLGGIVEFSTSQEEGTVFSITLPLK